MDWTIPGTVLTARREDARELEKSFSSMFLGGGVVLSQISGVTGVEAYDVQNWVKRGYLPPPVNKRYSLNQLCRIITIHMLRGVMSIEQICKLLKYVNGELACEADDVIDDARLYFLFVTLAAEAATMQTPEGRDSKLTELLQDYQEPVPGAKERVEKVLHIMLTAWAAAQLRKTTEHMLAELQA